MLRSCFAFKKKKKMEIFISLADFVKNGFSHRRRGIFHLPDKQIGKKIDSLLRNLPQSTQSSIFVEKNVPNFPKNKLERFNEYKNRFIRIYKMFGCRSEG